MADNGKDTKHARHIDRRMNLVINVEKCDFYKTVWYEVGLKLSEIVTNNFREDEFNTRLGYAVVRLENLQNNFQIGVTV